MELYIAEKPSVGRAIAENLGGPMRPVRGSKGPTHILVGSDQIVTWCFGHILELFEPDEYDAAMAKWREDLLPFVPQTWRLRPNAERDAKNKVKRDAKGKVVLDKGCVDQVNLIRDLIEQSDLVINAGDPDREGELLVMEVLDFVGNRKPVKRILPNAIDSASMKKILADVRDSQDFRGLYESALGRQRADWLVGMNFTRGCTLSNQRSGMQGVLSVGRVQTPTLAMIVKRDLEIENFKSLTFYDLAAHFKHANGLYTARWKPAKTQRGLDAEGRLIDESVASALAAAAQGKPGKIIEYKVEDGSQRAPLPFSLSALQSKASSRFGMSAQKVLTICQALYEVHKVATYPRTDCQYLPETQYADAPNVLRAIAHFDQSVAAHVSGADPKIRSQVWNNRKVTAHHAIIPTTNANYAALSADERKIFGLICQFYVAQFYPDFTFKKTSVLTECVGQQFVASGRTPVDLGWRKVFGAEADKTEDAKGNVAEEDSQVLPVMKNGDNVVCDKVQKDKKQTKPPAYYTEGTLIRAMTNVHEIVDDPETKRKLKEVKGIGTEATRASIIETLKKRQFVEVKASKIISTSAGRQFIASLPKELSDAAMTAMWENLLDKVEEGVLPLEKFLDGQSQFVSKMTKRILESRISIAVGFKNDRAGEAAREGAGAPCPKCGQGIMRLAQAKKGDNAGKYFLGCSKFPECKNTAEIAGQDTPAKRGSTTKGESGRTGTGTGTKSSTRGSTTK